MGLMVASTKLDRDFFTWRCHAGPLLLRLVSCSVIGDADSILVFLSRQYLLDVLEEV